MMGTKIGTGYSDGADGDAAGAQAAGEASRSLGRTPQLVFVFASTNYDFTAVLEAVRGEVGDAIVAGCSTAGQFNQDSVGRESVVVAAIASDSMTFHAGMGRNLSGAQPQAVADALEGFTAAHHEARRAGYPHTTCFVFADGLAGRGEELVDAIHDATGSLAQVVGGAAADAARFERTDVFLGARSESNALVTVAAFSKSPIGLGVRHGLESGCQSMIVTRTTDNVVHEIDGKPALQAYERFARDRGETLTAENRDTFMITHELGILTPTGEYKIRAPLSANDDGGLVMAAEVPTGASVSIMVGTADALVSAAGRAAQAGMLGLEGGPAAGVIVFDCICRRIFLGEGYHRQVRAIRDVVGDVPVAGWETYGEIAMTPSQQTGWHNSTTVLAVFPE